VYGFIPTGKGADGGQGAHGGRHIVSWQFGVAFESDSLPGRRRVEKARAAWLTWLPRTAAMVRRVGVNPLGRHAVSFHCACEFYSPGQSQSQPSMHRYGTQAIGTEACSLTGCRRNGP
jgi:hypothetical protein